MNLIPKSRTNGDVFACILLICVPLVSRISPTSAAAGSLHPTTFYVSTDGGDRNVGTDVNHPFRTTAALNKLGLLGPGTSILFRGGDTFPGAIQLRITGTADAPCLLSSYGTGMATLTDSAAVDKPICQLNDSEFVTVDRLRFVGTPGEHYPGPDFQPVNHAPGLFITSTLTTGTRWRSIAVQHCEFRNTYSGAWISCEGGPTVNGYDDVRVTGNRFDGCYQFGCYVVGYNSLKAGPVDQNRNVEISGNTFERIRGDPHVTSEAQPLGITSATGVVIDGNQFRDNCGFGGLIAGTPVGGSTALSVSNCRQFRICHNTVTGTHCDRRFDGSAIDADQDSRDGEIDHNFTYFNDGPSIQFGSFGKPYTGDLAIDHNLSINDVRGCKPDSVQGAVRFWGNSDHVAIFNNTIYVTSQGVIGAPSCISVDSSNNAGFVVANNILKTTGGIPMARPNGTVPGEYDPTHLDSSCRFIGNCYDASGSPLLICTDDTRGHYRDITTAQQWHGLQQESDGPTPRGVFGDAGLRSPAAFHPPADTPSAGTVHDFELLPASPCRGAGIDVGPYLTPEMLKHVQSAAESHNPRAAVDIGASTP